jgi:hypothetical protein
MEMTYEIVYPDLFLAEWLQKSCELYRTHLIESRQRWLKKELKVNRISLQGVSEMIKPAGLKILAYIIRKLKNKPL